MFEAKTESTVLFSFSSFGLQMIEIARLLFAVAVYFGALYGTNLMILTETSYEEAKALIAVKGCKEVSFLSYYPYVKLKSEPLSRRVSPETLHRLTEDGCNTIAGLDATSIALVPVGLFAGIAMFRFLIAAELAWEDVITGKYSRSRKRSFVELVHRVQHRENRKKAQAL